MVEVSVDLISIRSIWLALRLHRVALVAQTPVNHPTTTQPPPIHHPLLASCPAPCLSVGGCTPIVTPKDTLLPLALHSTWNFNFIYEPHFILSFS